jgi:hypothetical protein
MSDAYYISGYSIPSLPERTGQSSQQPKPQRQRSDPEYTAPQDIPSDLQMERRLYQIFEAQSAGKMLSRGAILNILV